MHDERAGRVEWHQIASAGSLRNALGDAMCRENHWLGGFWYFIELLHKNGAFGLQLVHDVAVVDNLVPHVDGGPVLGESKFDDLDGAVDARTEAARGCKKHAQRRAGSAACFV